MHCLQMSSDAADLDRDMAECITSCWRPVDREKKPMERLQRSSDLERDMADKPTDMLVGSSKADSPLSSSEPVFVDLSFCHSMEESS